MFVDESVRSTNLARTITVALFIAQVIYLVVFLPFQLHRLTEHLVVSAATLIALGALLLLIRQGRTNLSVILLIAFGMLAITIFVLSSGVRDAPLLSSYLTLTVMAGMLLGTRGVYIVAAASVTSIFTLAYLEYVGVIVPTVMESYLVAPLTWALVIGVMTVLLVLNNRELSRAHQRLRNREAQVRALLDTLPDSIVWIDATAHIQAVFPGDCEVRYVTPAHTGQSLYDTMPPEQADIRQQHVRDVLATGKMKVVPLTIEKSGEPPRHIESRFVPYRDQEVLIVSRDVTEKRASEHALRESEQRYRMMAENISDVVIATDLQGRITYASPSIISITGLSSDEITGMDSTATVHPDDHPRLAAAAETFMQTGQNHFRHRTVHKDGSVRWVEARSKLVLDDAGNPSSTIAVARDITEQHAAEQALRESERRLALAVDAGSIGLWDWNFETGEVVMNRRTEQMLGYEPGEIEAQVNLWDRFMHPDDKADAMREIWEHIASETNRYEAEYRVQTKSGMWKWVLDQGRIIERDAHRQPLRVIGTYMDITYQKQALAAVRDRESQYRGLIESQIDLVCRYLPDTTLTYVNEAYCNFFGKSRLDLIGKSFLPLNDHAVARDVRARIAEVCDNPAPGVNIFPAPGAEGKRRWIQWVDYGIADEHGDVTEIQAVGREVTALYETEAALRASEARFRAIVEQSVDGLLLLNDQGQIEIWNPALASLTGIPASEAVDQFIWDVTARLFPDRDLESVVDGLRQETLANLQPGGLAAEGVLSAYEIVTPGKQRLTVQSRTFSLDVDDQVFLVTLLRDVTERIRGERALREEQERTRRILQTSMDGFVLSNADGTIVDVNPAYCALVGYQRHELLGKSAWEFEVIDDSTIDQLRVELQKSGTTRFETAHRHKTGRIVELEVSVSGFDQNGQPLVASFTRDISRRKQIEGRIQHYIERLRLLSRIDHAVLLAESPENIAQAALDTMTEMGLYDRLVVNLFDYQSNEAVTLAGTGVLVQRVPLEIIHDGYDTLRNRDLFVVEDMLTLETISPAEQVWLDQGVRAYTMFPLVFGDELLGALTLGSMTPGVFDSERTSLAREVADHLAIAIQQARLHDRALLYADELERRVNELQVKNAEIERFTYTVSHDLKSPLITIRGFLDLLGNDISSGNTERALDDMAYIQDAAARMQSLLDDLLELSRIGRLKNTAVHMSLSEPAGQAARLVAGSAMETGAQITVDPDLPAAWIDHPRLVEVFQNLLENAIKFSAEASPPLIHVGQRQDDGRTVVIVTDNGVGIPPQYHEKVFGLFEQLDPNRGGTGIGLALVQRIVHVHNGRIWIEPGDPGTVFCLELEWTSDE